MRMNIWELMQSIKSDTESTINRCEAMEGKVTVPETQVRGTVKLSDDVKALQSTVSLLCKKLTRNEITVSRLSKEVVELKAHSMKHNILFNFYRNTDICKEVEGEDCVGVIKRFLTNIMSVPNVNKMYVPVAHRLGKRATGTTRAILAKFPNANDIDTILKHTNRLRETKHFVQRQLPPSINERKQFALVEYKKK